MGSRPKLPREQPVTLPPNLLDPTVMFARMREKNKAMQASGRASTILTKPLGKMMPSLGTTTGGTY